MESAFSGEFPHSGQGALRPESLVFGFRAHYSLRGGGLRIAHPHQIVSGSRNVNMQPTRSGPRNLVLRYMATVFIQPKVSSTRFRFLGGSGSTLIGCQRLGRQARLMEIDPRYVDVIVRRWQAFTGEHAVLDGAGRIFDEVAKARGKVSA